MIRLPAEWEKQEILQVVFPSKNSDWSEYLEEIRKTYINLIKQASSFQKVQVITQNLKETAHYLKDIQNIELLEFKTDDTWIRDFGIIQVFDDDKILNYDFTFNGWGGKYNSQNDNQLNQKMYKNLIKVDFVLEGGSIESNGNGVLLTTSKCLLNKNRNPNLSKMDIENRLKALFGIKEILWLEGGFLAGDDTDFHIDMVARFMDKNTICYLSCSDRSDIHYKELKNIENQLKTFDFDLIPIPMPTPIFYKDRRLAASYLNFTFINDAILLPIYNVAQDQEVIKLFEEFYPNRKIIQIDSSILIRENGSIHCGSKNIFARSCEERDFIVK